MVEHVNSFDQMWELSKIYDPLLVFCYYPEFAPEELLEQLSARFMELENEEGVKFVLANMEIGDNFKIEDSFVGQCRLAVYKYPKQVAVFDDIDINSVDYYSSGFQFVDLQEYK
ncbi:MAG: hypothetical protein SH848_01845 [Saprospiraceae bacterium]|nr:hypothetical protein [Saprospiraceae bacterium]MDZ4702639.1 hypothetical protein [Saprospiraceae bacterium]